MKIAFTHNLKLADTEEQAEFDSPETISALASALRELGHDVHLVDVSGLASRLVARLEALHPDLVFNTAEGTHGRYREAFYPALFEQLRIPFTGSGAYVCALDKQASKLLVSQRGIPTPQWYFFDGTTPWEPPQFRYPVIVKPNFEGSSKGITERSVVTSREELDALVQEMLPRYSSGLLVEEFIVGIDVTVPYLEASGVLTPASYEFAPAAVAGRKWLLYDYALKNHDSDAVSVRVPAVLPPETLTRVRDLAARVVAVLGLRDVARVDFRVTEDGEIYFIEVNALPSLEPGASLYESAAAEGLHSVGAVLTTILDSASRRQQIAPGRPRGAKIRVGLTYNLKRVDPRSGSDVDAEYDSPTTVGAIHAALEQLGHDVVDLEATPELLSVLPASDVDVVFNIAEGLRGRNREAQIPAVLELLDIPYTGSDPATLAITLDKGLAKRLVREAGMLTPRARLVGSVEALNDFDLDFPVIAKPNAEGSSKGVTQSSVCESLEELQSRVAEMTKKYGQVALIEEFLPGREFTIAVLGEHELRALPPMEIVFDAAMEHPVYTFGHKIETESGVRYEVPANVDSALGQALSDLAVGVFQTLGCRDVARIDARLDAQGRPQFIECNPLPGLTPGWSDLCLIAAASGIDYTSLIGEILAPALRRLQMQSVSEHE